MIAIETVEAWMDKQGWWHELILKDWVPGHSRGFWKVDL